MNLVKMRISFVILCLMINVINTREKVLLEWIMKSEYSHIHLWYKPHLYTRKIKTVKNRLRDKHSRETRRPVASRDIARESRASLSWVATVVASRGQASAHFCPVSSSWSCREPQQWWRVATKLLCCEPQQWWRAATKFLCCEPRQWNQAQLCVLSYCLLYHKQSTCIFNVTWTTTP